MSDDDLQARRRAATPNCERFLYGQGWTPPAAWLRQIAESAAGPDAAAEPDRYGEHGEVAALEREIAELLGKPAAAFMPSGIMAQQAVLRAWAERSPGGGPGGAAIAVHGLSHLVVHELDALSELHRLRLVRLTDAPRQPTVADLAAVPEPLAAATLELPLRDAGYLLPGWDDLVAFAAACRERGVPLHLDGARLWESQPFYGRPHAEIAGLADSVYVSFYKGLGGLAGACVAGPEDVVAEARRWQRRHGGTLFTLLPYAVAARAGLRRELPRMPAYHDRAVALAAALNAAGLRTVPEVPHTTAFRLFAPATAQALGEAVVTRMERDRVALTPPWQDAEVPGWAFTEITVGPATLEWDLDEAVAALAGLLPNLPAT